MGRYDGGHGGGGDYGEYGCGMMIFLCIAMAIWYYISKFLAAN